MKMTIKRYRIAEINSPRQLADLRSDATHKSVRNAMNGVVFNQLLTNSVNLQKSDLFVVQDSYNSKLYEMYFHISNGAHLNAICGEFVFESISTLGYDSILVDQENGVFFIGQMLSCSREYFNWWIANSSLGFIEWEGDGIFTADLGLSSSGTEDAILLNAPGYGIFGHWLIDFVPRMALSRLMNGAEYPAHLFGPLADWMKNLVTLAGIQHVKPAGIGFSAHTRLRVPSSTKSGYGFSEPVNSFAWRSLALKFNHLNVSNPLNATERLFVSRKHWQGGRAIDFHDELESLMLSHGFRIVYPETLSLAEQAHLFSTARIVVGEDGSALHNVIFSAAGARLGVLMDEHRDNLWHAGICHLLGHQIAYAPLPRSLDSQGASLSQVSDFVRALVNS